MKIRNGLVLAMAILFGLTGCASGGGGGGGGVTLADLAAGAAEGERPRDTENTRTAERHLEAGDEAEDEAEARMHYELALTAAEAAIAEDATNPLAYRLAAMSALGLERYAEAGEYFDRATELRPIYEFDDQPLRERTWIDLYQEATPLVSSGDYEAAAEIFENAHAIYQGRPEIMVTLAQIYASIGEHDKALEFMDRTDAFMGSEVMSVVDSATAADWRESAADLPVLRAQVYSADGRFEEAAAAFRELSAQDPTNLEYVRNLAAVLMQGGNEAEALQVYEDLLNRPGLSGQDLYSIGVGFYQASDYARAVQAFGGAAGTAPQNRDALEMWARSLQLAESYQEIPPVARRWVELDPYSQNGYLIMAQAANQTGDSQTTQEAMGAAQGLEVAVDQLQMQHFSTGGGIVNGQVVNKTASEGSSVTLRFTFYGTSGSPIGSVTETVTLAGTDMASVFRVQFDSAEQVSGYGYELTIG